MSVCVGRIGNHEARKFCVRFLWFECFKADDEDGKAEEEEGNRCVCIDVVFKIIEF